MIGAASSLSGQEKSTDVIHSPQNWGYLVSLLPGIVSRMARLLRYVAVVALVGVATASLTACSGDPGPIVTESPSLTRTVEATPSPSPTATLTPEEELLAQIPEDARGEDFQSATQFSRFFIGLYPALFASEPETEPFATLSAPQCRFCSGALADADETRVAGGHSEGGEFTWPGDVLRGGLQDDGFWYITQDFEVTDTVTYLADGSEYRVSLGGPGEVGVKLRFDRGMWHVYGIEFVYDD